MAIRAHNVMVGEGISCYCQCSHSGQQARGHHSDDDGVGVDGGFAILPMVCSCARVHQTSQGFKHCLCVQAWVCVVDVASWGVFDGWTVAVVYVMGGSFLKEG